MCGGVAARRRANRARSRGDGTARAAVGRADNGAVNGERLDVGDLKVSIDVVGRAVVDHVRDILRDAPNQHGSGRKEP